MAVRISCDKNVIKYPVVKVPCIKHMCFMDCTLRRTHFGRSLLAFRNTDYGMNECALWKGSVMLNITTNLKHNLGLWKEFIQLGIRTSGELLQSR